MKKLLAGLLVFMSTSVFAYYPYNYGWYGPNNYYGSGYIYSRPGYYGQGFQGYQQDQTTCLPAGCIAPQQNFTAQPCPSNIWSQACEMRPKEYRIDK